MIERYVKDLFYLFVFLFVCLFGLKWNERIEMKMVRMKRRFVLFIVYL